MVPFPLKGVVLGHTGSVGLNINHLLHQSICLECSIGSGWDVVSKLKHMMEYLTIIPTVNHCNRLWAQPWTKVLLMETCHFFSSDFALHEESLGIPKMPQYFSRRYLTIFILYSSNK